MSAVTLDSVPATYRTLGTVTERATGKTSTAHLHCIESAVRRMPSVAAEFEISRLLYVAASDWDCGYPDCPGRPTYGDWE